jgi:hypothetical protein
MVQGDDARYLRVRLSVSRRDGWRQWGAVRGDFGRELAGQESTTVIGPRVDSEVRRGRDYVRVVIAMTVAAPDVAAALNLAWLVFRKAVGNDAESWDISGASAEVKPG